MANAPHATRPARTASAVRRVDLHVVDAMGELRHQTRILALATIGLIHCPDEVHGHQGGPYNIDDDWSNDVQSLALEVAYDLEKIVSAMEGQS